MALQMRTRSHRPIRKWADHPTGTTITGILWPFRQGPGKWGGLLADFDHDSGERETVSLTTQLREAFEGVALPAWVQITYRGEQQTRRGNTVHNFDAGDDPERTAAWRAAHADVRPVVYTALTRPTDHGDGAPPRTAAERPGDPDGDVPF